jgi:hypothetical protein
VARRDRICKGPTSICDVQNDANDKKEEASAIKSSDYSSMDVQITEELRRRVTFRLSGDPANSVVPYTPTWATPSITWDFYLLLELDNDGRPILWRLLGAGLDDAAHDPFPAYELEVNKRVIYRRDPIPNGNNPQDLGNSSEDMIKLDIGGRM